MGSSAIIQVTEVGDMSKFGIYYAALLQKVGNNFRYKVASIATNGSLTLNKTYTISWTSVGSTYQPSFQYYLYDYSNFPNGWSASAEGTFSMPYNTMYLDSISGSTYSPVIVGTPSTSEEFQLDILQFDKWEICASALVQNTGWTKISIYSNDSSQELFSNWMYVNDSTLISGINPAETISINSLIDGPDNISIKLWTEKAGNILPYVVDNVSNKIGGWGSMIYGHRVIFQI